MIDAEIRDMNAATHAQDEAWFANERAMHFMDRGEIYLPIAFQRESRRFHLKARRLLGIGDLQEAFKAFRGFFLADEWREEDLAVLLSRLNMALPADEFSPNAKLARHALSLVGKPPTEKKRAFWVSEACRHIYDFLVESEEE